MLSPDIGGKPVAEQAMGLAYKTPSVYSDCTERPIEDIGMGHLSDEALAEFFEDKRVLDIGSGAEGLARRLYKIFGDSQSAPEVINLNPQLGHDTQGPIMLASIKSVMAFFNEDFAGYMRQRKAVVGVVQDLPFEDGSFDVQVSTWGFPKCIFDCRSDYYMYSIDSDEHARQGYREIIRTQAAGGIALLAPVLRPHEVDASKQHLQSLATPAEFSHTFVPISGLNTVLQIRKTEPATDTAS